MLTRSDGDVDPFLQNGKAIFERGLGISVKNNKNKGDTMDLQFAEEMLNILNEVWADASCKSLVLTAGDANFFFKGRLCGLA